MAQLLNPPSIPGARISQLLPTVKCSTCGSPVPLDQLGDHVCPPTPPVPTPRSPPASKPPAVRPLRIQNLVSPTRSHSPSSSSSSGSSRASAVSRSSYASTASAATVTSNSRRTDRPRPAQTPPPTHPPPRIPSPQSQAPLTHRGPSPLGSPLSPNRPAAAPERAVSPASTVRSYRSDGRGAPTEPPARTPSAASYRPPAAPATSPAIPSILAAGRGPSTAPHPPHLQLRARAPSNASSIRSRNDTQPSPQAPYRRPSVTQPEVPQAAYRRPSTNADGNAAPTRSAAPPLSPYSPTGPPLSPYSPRPPPSPTPSHFSAMHMDMGPEIDTKSGGEAGMAGVGRRGFAAAARAAMFANAAFGGPASPGPGPGGTWMQAPPPQGMDGRRANAPKWLDIGSADPTVAAPVASPSPVHDHTRDSNATITGRPDDYSPSSIPFPIKPPPPAPFMSSGEPMTPTTPNTPRLPFFEKYRNKFPAADVGPDAVAVMVGKDGHDADTEVVGELAPISMPLSPTDDGSEYGGLAYRTESESEYEADEPAPQPSASKRRPSASSASSSAYSGRSYGGAKRVSGTTATGGVDISMDALLRSPASSDAASLPRSPASVSASPRTRPLKLPTRSHTTPSQRDSTRSLGLGGPTGSGRRGGTISGALNGAAREKEKEKEKEREREEERERERNVSVTSASEAGSVRSRVRECVKCGKKIEDGRWIRVESGKGVLCDRCWKNMYLPKCRRCNLPIEKQAVSSSDGQLKGKYHRECFNCHTCHKPFPDKSFYVWDGKPFCAYHYHEANNSLCALPECGQPIEGPCAVSHNGSQFHPEHLMCEYESDAEDSDEDEDEDEDEDDDSDGPGVSATRKKVRMQDSRNKGRCTVRLVEYWEVEGRMLCEQHMRRVVIEQDQDSMSSVSGSTSSRTRARRGARRAMKRMTVFIDLAGTGSDSLR